VLDVFGGTQASIFSIIHVAPIARPIARPMSDVAVAQETQPTKTWVKTAPIKPRNGWSC